MAYRTYAGATLPETNQAGLTYVKGSWYGETLNGTSGANEFEGGGGRDVFIGGGGDDYYWMRDPKDLIVEYGGGGVDTARIWSSYTLPANVENLISFGEGSYAAGNALNNIVQGLDGAQFIYGGTGQDVLIGGGGADIFVVRQGEGDKVIQDFSSWSDKVRVIGGDLTSFQAIQGAMKQEGADVTLNNGGTMIAFRNATISQFQARDFQIPLDMKTLGAPTFNDDFNSLQTGSVWKTNFGYAGDGLGSFTLPNNSEMQIYVSPEFKGTSGAPLGQNPYSVNNGVLTLTASPASAELAADIWGYKYTSGMLISNYTQTYGYFEIRAELPHGQGLWPAFWMIGPNNNEIDILEGLGSDTKTPNNAIHSNAVPAAGSANFLPDDSGFHTYGALWTPSDIVFYADGTEIWRTPTPSDMNKPMQMIVNLAVGGPWAGAPDATTPWPGQMKIDYIRAYGLPQAVPTTPAPSTPAPTTPAPATGDLLLISPGPGSSLTGGGGADTLQASQGADVLTGGGGADVFAFRAMPWSAGRITDFQVSSDRLDVSDLYKGYVGTDPVRDGYVRFEADGAGGTRVMVDPDGPGSASPWAFTVTTLTGVAPSSLTAANLVGGSPSGTTTSPPPTTPATGVDQVLTAASPAANLSGASGADTLNAGQGAGTFTGGAGADVFSFKAMPWSAGHVADFTVGVDRLAISTLYTNGYAGTDPIKDGYVSFLSDGAGGTKVMLDVDGPAGASTLKFHVVTLDKVAPGGLNTANVFGGDLPSTTPDPTVPAPGAAAGVVLTSPYPGAPLVGGAGADTLNASQGSDALTGGAGADRFVFGKLPWTAGHVTDFQHGVDVIDLRPLFAAAGYAGLDPVADGYLRLEASGAGGVKLLFDSDGWGSGNPWPIHVTTLDGVAPSGLSSADWLFH